MPVTDNSSVYISVFDKSNFNLPISDKSNFDTPVSNNNCLGCIVSVVTGIASAVFSRVYAIWNWVVGCFAENESRRDLLNRIEARLADPNEPSVAKLYFRELKEKVSATKSTQDPTLLCNDFETTSEQYQALVHRVEAAVHRPEPLTLDAAEALYQDALTELEDLKTLPITETERSIYTGRITQAFRELDNAFAQENGRPLHRFCGCHILEEGKTEKRGKEQFTLSYPSELSNNPNLDGRSAILQSWSLGGGHNVAQRGISQRLAEVGMHAYHVEADNETLRPTDMLRGLTGGRWSDADVIRFLLRHNCWKILRFINWMLSGKPSPEKSQYVSDLFMRSILARGVPELHMTIYGRNTGAAANGAGQLGAAAIHISTDLVSDVCDVDTSDDLENPHFVNAAMVPGHDVNAQSLALFGLDRTVITGFPVRKAFLQEYNEEALNALRDQYGIDRDARIVVLGSGGEGIENGYAEYVVNYYKTHPDLPKIHLAVLCGRNTAKKEKLEKKFAALNNPQISVRVLGWANEEELAQLNAMGADPNRRGALISTKGGGGTLSEGLASGIPMLLGSSDDVEWEKRNIDFVCEKGCGLRFNGESDVLEKLFLLFKMPYQRIHIDSKKESMRLIEQQTQLAEGDQPFQALRADALRFQPPPLIEV